MRQRSCQSECCLRDYEGLSHQKQAACSAMACPLGSCLEICESGLHLNLATGNTEFPLA